MKQPDEYKELGYIGELITKTKEKVLQRFSYKHLSHIKFLQC